MTLDDDQALEAILGPARSFLEPEPADAARVLRGLRQLRDSSGSGGGSSRPSAELPVNPRALSWASRAGVRLASVTILAASVGFLAGFSLGRRSSEPRSLDAMAERPAQRLDAPGLQALEAPAEPSPPGLSQRPERAAPPLVPGGMPALPTRTSRAALTAGAPGKAQAAGEELSLGQALELLHRARTAQAAGHPNAALLLLSELDRRAPGDMLTEERLLAQVLIWCDLGNRAEAERWARALREKNPSSIYSHRLARSCAGALPAQQH